MAATGISPWRKTAGSTIARLGLALGIVFALGYEVLMCTLPAPDWSQMHLRTFINGYVAAPMIIFGLTSWLADWIAGRLDRDRPRD